MEKIFPRQKNGVVKLLICHEKEPRFRILFVKSAAFFKKKKAHSQSQYEILSFFFAGALLPTFCDMKTVAQKRGSNAALVY